MRPIHATPTTADVRIGPHLRAARTHQGLTLAQVADAAGLTRGFLSRVERDETSPSVSTLVRICQVLSLRMGDLFAEPAVVHIPLDAAPSINMGGVGAVERLVSARTESRVQVLHSTLEPDATGGKELYSINCEIEVLHVVSGELTLRLTRGDIVCSEGDSLTLPGQEPHSWTAGPNGAVVLWVLVPAAWSGAS